MNFLALQNPKPFGAEESSKNLQYPSFELWHAILAAAVEL
jgi:hypothetical protein